MISQKIQDALNSQINIEFHAFYTYLAMAAWCERRAFRGSANWLRVQHEEEYEHAMKLYNFLLARDCEVKLAPIKQPNMEFESLLDVFEAALDQEAEVSRRIDSLYEAAYQENAYASLVELQWFVSEQVEEEKSVREIVKHLRMVQDDPSGLLEVDRELGSRQGK